MYYLRMFYRRIFLILFLTYKHFLRNFISTSGLFITLLIIFSIIAVLRPLKNEIERKIKNSLPADVIRVTAKQRRSKLNLVGIFSAKKDYRMGVQRWQLNKIKKIPHVKDVGMTSILQMPLTGTIDEPFFQNFGAHSELILQGVSYNLVKPYLKCRLPYKNTFRNGIITVPVVVPESFADMALAFATINGLPSFSRQQMIGLKLKFNLGDSIIARNRQKFIIPVRGVICGFAPANMVTAIGVPYSWVHKLHRSRKMQKAYNSFDQVFVFVDNHQNVKDVTKQILDMNLQIPKSEQGFDKLFDLLKNFDLFFKLFALVLGVLSIIAMVNSFMLLAYQRKYEFGLYLVFGSSPPFIWLLMIFQGLFFGALHCLLALYTGEYLFSSLHSTLLGNEIFSVLNVENLAFQLSNTEKFFMLLLSMTVGALSSLLPSISVMGRKTIRLIRRDS